ncbi:hypothetical protein K0M31_012382 [Melipona bicolor]|uniref:Uncharacterized protein n=1 Tax=Melipona bicolor TaxID=60889 RepID=A0AA40FJR8_9HYME|nr:hypothetical protein K0M31_012382 [Melipona bicolor]
MSKKNDKCHDFGQRRKGLSICGAPCVAKNQNRQALARGERGTKETRPPCRKICMGQRAVASDSIIAGQRHTDYVGPLKNKEHFETKEDHRLLRGCRGLLGPWVPFKRD